MTHRPATDISTPAELISGIPALLGFVPTESVICIALVGSRVLFTTRTDITDIAVFGMGSAIDAATRHDVDSVVLVTVSASDTGPRTSAEFAAAGIAVIGNYHVPTLSERSWALDLDTAEVVEVDARNSVVAARSVHSGASIERSRDAVAARYIVGEPITPATGDVYTAGTLEELAETVAAGSQPAPDLIARAAAIIVDVTVRDAMTRLACYGRAHDAMATIARHSRGDARIHALSLAGLFAHLDGDSAANLAFTAALRECGESEPPRLLVLLDAAVQAGMSPAEMRGTIADADTVRESTGAYLPGND